MATNRKPAGGGGKGKSTKPKSLMSPKTAAQFALNDLLTLHEGDDESPEVVQARKVLKDAGFNARPSRAQEIKKIEEEIKGIDATQPGAAALMVDLGKRLSAAQRGKVQADKKKE